MQVNEEDMVYARPGGVELALRHYRAEGSARVRAVVSLHGGAWHKNDRTSAHVLDRALARAGYAVFALDFRQAPDFQHPTASQDVAAGVRFVRANAAALAVDEGDIGLVGSSSGGHLALLAALCPDAPQFRGTPCISLGGESPGDVSAAVRYVAALWPVSDPLIRLRFALDTGRDDLVQATRNYFASEEAMRGASVQRILDDGEAEALPPAFIAQPGADANVPQPMTFELLRAYQARQGSIEYAFYPRQAHAFTYDDSPEARRCIDDVIRFADKQVS